MHRADRAKPMSIGLFDIVLLLVFLLAWVFAKAYDAIFGDSSEEDTPEPDFDDGLKASTTSTTPAKKEYRFK